MSRTIAARVEDETYQKVVNAATARGLSVNDFVKSCVEDHLNGKNERKQTSIVDGWEMPGHGPYAELIANFRSALGL